MPCSTPPTSLMPTRVCMQHRSPPPAGVQTVSARPDSPSDPMRCCTAATAARQSCRPCRKDRSCPRSPWLPTAARRTLPPCPSGIRSRARIPAAAGGSCRRKTPRRPTPSGKKPSRSSKASKQKTNYIIHLIILSIILFILVSPIYAVTGLLTEKSKVNVNLSL